MDLIVGFSSVLVYVPCQRLKRYSAVLKRGLLAGYGFRTEAVLVQEEGTSNELSGSVRGNAVQVGRLETLNLLGSPEAAPTQWQVPAEEPGFVNRTRELASMTGVLDQPASAPVAPTIVLTGPAGVGKSELGRRFAASARDRFPDGQLYVRLGAYRSVGGAIDLADAFRALLGSLGVAEQVLPSSTEDLGRLYRSRMFGRRALVVVDDAELASQALALTPGQEGALLVTSQRRLEELRGGRTLALPVGPLDPAEGMALIAEQIGSRRVEAEPEQAAALVELCAGLPVLLRAISASLVSRPHRLLADLVSGLRDAGARARQFERAGVFAVLDESYEQLGESGARVYRVLALMPGAQLAAEPIAAVIGKSLPDVEEGLDDLVTANLLEELPGTRFVPHAMIRMHAAHVAERTWSPAERSELTRRVVAWYLRRGQVADRVIAPVRLRLPASGVETEDGASPVPGLSTVDHALGWLETEHLALLHCVRAAAENQWDETVWLLCDPLWMLYQHHKHYAAWIEAFGLGVAAADRAGNGWVGARVRCLLARAHIELAEFDEAERVLAPALDLARAAGDPLLEASVLEFDGVLGLRSRRFGPAIELFTRAREVLAHTEQTPDSQRADLLLRYHTGRACTGLGRRDEAVRLLEAAYAEAGEVDQRLAGQVRFALIDARLARGEAELAEPLAVLAVQEAGRRAVPVEQVRSLRLLADCQEAAGETDAAAELRAHAQRLQEGLEGNASADR